MSRKVNTELVAKAVKTPNRMFHAPNRSAYYDKKTDTMQAELYNMVVVEDRKNKTVKIRGMWHTTTTREFLTDTCVGIRSVSFAKTAKENVIPQDGWKIKFVHPSKPVRIY